MVQKQSIIEQFESSVKKYSGNVAVKTNKGLLSYDELNRKANGLAHLIRSSAVGSEPNVALLLDHNEEMIIGILGVLKSGKAYVPVDPYFPLERCRKILNDSQSVIIITTQRQLSLAYKLVYAAAREVHIINIEDINDLADTDSGLKIHPAQAAYVLYTSGSTGQPKGVVQSHGTIVSSISHYITELDIKESDNILLTTPYSHTVSVIDIFSALFAGASLSVLSVKRDFVVNEFSSWLRKMGVSIIHTVPTFYRYFVKSVTDTSDLDKVRLVILGGEEVFPNDVQLYKQKFSDHCLFINLYGSSEVILATLNIVNKDFTDNRKTVSIGFPFDFIEAVILDENNKEMKGHGTGEIYFAGESLNPKYYMDPAGTNSLFSLLEGHGSQKFVRTGDLVKRLPDGSFQLMGRKDSQVKINGNRVHMNEIELILNSLETVAQSVVIPMKNESDNISLVAYIETEHEKPDTERLKEVLRVNLPEYMIPSIFVKLDKIPVTANGKIDRNSLPKISYEELKRGDEVNETTELQKKILNIWECTFGKEDMTIHDNFFQLGGNSLIATEILNKLSALLGREIELSTIFDYQSAFELARFLENERPEQIFDAK